MNPKAVIAVSHQSKQDLETEKATHARDHIAVCASDWLVRPSPIQFCLLLLSVYSL